MGKELIISANRHETKVAILEDDQLVEVYFQRANEYSLAGSIHKGRVTRVLPGMQSAFVNIGLDRDAFLYVSDFFEDNDEYDRIASAAEEKALKADKPGAERTADRPFERNAERQSDRNAERPAERAPERVAEARPAEVRPVETAPASEPAARPPERSAAPLQHAEDGSDRDRRGRRSRRRRQRGRGFPDSKYANVREEPTEPAPAETIEAVAEVETPVGDFAVLPGETLAKYSHGDASNGDEVEYDAAGETADAEPIASDPTLAMGSPTEEEEAPEEPEAASAPENPQELSSPEPLLEEPVVEQDVAGAAEAQGETVWAPEPEIAESSPTTEPEGDGDPALVTELPENAIPEEVTEPEAEAAAPQEPAPDAEAAPGADDVEPARMPVSLTATLREQGYRYMHRVSRRARRKMRNSGFPGGPEEERPERPAEAPPEPKPEVRTAPRQESSRTADRPAQPSISELLKEGQEVLVQIAKEPLGQKGARITSHIALPGRFVVYMPTVEHLGVSRKISTDEERLRLKRILHAHRSGIPGGFIVRTAGEGKSEDEIASDMQFLFNMWLDIRQRAEARRAPALIHHDLDVVSRILRDQMTDTFKTVWVDNEEIYESVLRFVERFQPALVGRIKLYTRNAPIFDSFNVSAELEKALRPKVWLKSGGYIVINQTEALVAVDVNTGKFVGKSNRLEDTIVKTNTEAVKEIVRQIRLRDLGGIIVVDFIDMDERKNRQKVMQALEEAMRSDRAPNKILQFNDFGLVAITRKRVKQSLERTLCSPCPYCEGAGYVKSVQTVIGEILQEAQKIAKVVEGKDITLRVHADVAKVLKASDNDYLEELEEVLGRPVIVVSDALLQQEKFDLI
jgi:ribonuclease G